MRSKIVRASLLVVPVLLVVCQSLDSESDIGAIQLDHQKKQDRVQVRINEEVFTNYLYKGHPRPLLYPVYGPEGIRMIRHYPLKEGVENESNDHPHHMSLWYTHGKVNGHDFWHGDKNRIVHNKFLALKKNVIRTRNKWVSKGGEVQCTDTRTMRFRTVPGGRALDIKITLHASEGTVVFGDTKEGTMAIRTHPGLRMDRGAHATNSNGTEGKMIWGESAKWVYYAGEIDGTNVGVAIFDHPQNPRYPTTWHARHYGLIAANPFGYSYFKGGDHNGAMTIEAGKQKTFRYRFLFIKGTHKNTEIPKRFRRWKQQDGTSSTPD